MRRFRAMVFPVLALLCVALPGSPSMAATTTFFPEASADVTRSDNVLYSSAESASDWISRFGIVLPVRREGPRGSVGLQYSPSLFRYRDNSDLDHQEHRVGLDARSVGRRQTLAFGAGWERSQTQGTAGGLSTFEPFVVPRSEREHYRGEVTYERQSGERWRWNTALRGDRTDYSQFQEPGPSAPGTGIENRTAWEATLGARRAISRATAFGVEYRFQRYLLERTGDEDAHLLGLTMNVDAGRDATVGLRLGAFHRKPQVAAGGAASDTGQANGVQGGLQVERRFRRNALRFEAEHGPTSGGGLSGTSTDSLAALSLTGARERRWQWAASARYAKRRPSLAGTSTLTTSGGAASAAWIFGEKWAFTLGAEYVRQSANDADTLGTSFKTFTGGLTWYPRGLARPAAGGGG